MIPIFDQQRYSIVRKMIMSCNHSDRIACDLGSGKYPVTDEIMFAKRITIDKDKKNNPDMVADLRRKFPLKAKSMDIVVACEIIEHMFDTDKFLKEVNRVLVPNGGFIISTPNICSARYRLAFLLGKIPAHASKGSVNAHVRDFNVNELCEALIDNGFVIEEAKTDGIWTGNCRIPSPTSLGDSIIMRCWKA